MTKARSKDNMKAFRRLTRSDGGEVRFVSDPPVLVPLDELFDASERDVIVEWLRERIRSYRQSLPDDRRHLLERYRLVDFARKVVGVDPRPRACRVRRPDQDRRIHPR
jgi:hypothetical protein